MSERRDFLKKLGAGLAGAALPSPSLSKEKETELIRAEIRKEGALIREQLRLNPIRINVSAPSKPYYDWKSRVESTTVAMGLIEGGDFSAIEEVSTNVRWMFNRLDDWGEKAVMEFSGTQAFRIIEDASDRLNALNLHLTDIGGRKRIPLTSGFEVVEFQPGSPEHQDHAERLYIHVGTIFITHGQSFLARSKKRRIPTILRRIGPFYRGCIRDQYNLNINLYSWAANLCNEAGLLDDAFHFAQMDQSLRTNGTNSRLLKKLTKLRTHG